MALSRKPFGMTAFVGGRRLPCRDAAAEGTSRRGSGRVWVWARLLLRSHRRDQTRSTVVGGLLGAPPPENEPHEFVRERGSGRGCSCEATGATRLERGGA